MIQILSRSESETKALGEFLGKKFQGGIVLALLGNLGSGKTTFVKGLARGLGVKSTIRSPTFVILSPHRLQRRRAQTFYHIDLYRLKKTREFLELGLREILEARQNITAIEWPERARILLPKNTIYLEFRLGAKPGERVIKIW